MRQPRFNIIVIVMLALCASFGVARADDRADARTHYQAGTKFYANGDYRSAIKEFGLAQQLAPADLNNYNLALCYDKLGEAEPAIQYYKEYLNKVPDAPKRSEIEASIARLDGALKSAATKKADEAKKADDAKKAEEAKKAEDAKKAEEAKKADEAKQPPAGPDTKTPDGAAPPVPTGVGSTGTPSTGLTVSTGDAQLDRVASIDVNAVRDQRIGGASSGLPADNRGPASAGPNGPNGQNAAWGANGAPPPNGAQPNGMAPPNPNGNPNAVANAGPNGQAQPADKPAPPKEDPVYKKWWFWAVVAVSAYVVYEIATQGSNSSTAHEMLPLNHPGAGIQPGGVTLLHF